MRIGAGIVLFTVGAIFAFAISWSPSGFNIQTVGVIFMLVGIVWVIAAILLYRNQRRATVITERHEVPGADGEAEYIEERRSYGEPDPRERIWTSGPETTPYAEPQSPVAPEATESGYEPEPAPYETDESNRPLWPGRHNEAG